MVQHSANQNELQKTLQKTNEMLVKEVARLTKENNSLNENLIQHTLDHAEALGRLRDTYEARLAAAHESHMADLRASQHKQLQPALTAPLQAIHPTQSTATGQPNLLVTPTL